MINGNKLVSIIIPVFNRSEDLSRCLESITNLNYNNIEVIVIDDNSSEDIEVICNNYKKVYFYRNKVNGGPAESKNNGINRATGDFLWFIDSDAIIVDCNVLSCMINIMESDDSIGCLGGDLITNEKAGDSKYKVKDHIMFANADGYPVILERCDVNMREVELIPTSNCFTRTSIMKKVGGGFEVRYRYLYEDTDYCYRVKKLGYKNIIDKKTLILHNPSNISRYSTFYMLQRNRIMFVLLNKNILTILFLPVLDVYFFIISFPIKLKLMSANNSTLIKKEKKSTRAVIKASFFYVSSFVAAYAYNIFNIADIITRRKNRGV